MILDLIGGIALSFVTTQMDRLKGEGFYEPSMGDQTKLGAFDPADEPAVFIYRLTAGFPRKVVRYGFSHSAGSGVRARGINKYPIPADFAVSVAIAKSA